VHPFDDRMRLGVIAQELERVYPEAVFTDSTGYKSVAYDMLIAPLIEAVKELNARDATLNAKIDALMAENAALKARQAEFERRLEALEAARQ
jgi:uncharacterized protein YlxW (UPF0749 family)